MERKVSLIIKRELGRVKTNDNKIHNIHSGADLLKEFE